MINAMPIEAPPRPPQGFGRPSPVKPERAVFEGKSSPAGESIIGLRAGIGRLGFTLVEVLAALALTSFLAVILFGNIDLVRRLTLKPPQAGYEKALSDMNRIERYLRNALEIAPAGKMSFKLEIEKSDGSQKLELTAPTGAQSANSDCVVYSKIRMTASASGALEVMIGDPDDAAAQPEVFRLFKGVSSIRITCMGTNGEWAEEWNPEKSLALPAAVRFEFTYPLESRMQPMSCTVALRSRWRI